MQLYKGLVVSFCFINRVSSPEPHLIVKITTFENLENKRKSTPYSYMYNSPLPHHYSFYFYCWCYHRCPHPLHLPTFTKLPPHSFPLPITALLSVSMGCACMFLGYSLHLPSASSPSPLTAVSLSMSPWVFLFCSSVYFVH